MYECATCGASVPRECQCHGGPAFPRTAFDDKRTAGGVNGCDGMSLRDYFAAHALAHMVGLYDVDEMTPEHPGRFAAVAYDIADAMLQARALPRSPSASSEEK
jgi:hypothetical protein